MCIEIIFFFFLHVYSVPSILRNSRYRRDQRQLEEEEELWFNEEEEYDEGKAAMRKQQMFFQFLLKNNHYFQILHLISFLQIRRVINSSNNSSLY